HDHPDEPDDDDQVNQYRQVVDQHMATFNSMVVPPGCLSRFWILCWCRHLAGASAQAGKPVPLLFLCRGGFETRPYGLS
ncbi:MAG TPA: hypothetical protein VGA79_11145, partial [Desulfobaccales bacterium]